MKETALHVLLVDDDEVDRELFKDAIGLSSNKYEVTEAADGRAALDYLQGKNRKPHIIILDLNMPVMDGRETLKTLKSDPELRNLPVCIMSTSSAHFDVRHAYEMGANLFLVKPSDFKQLMEMLDSLLTLFRKYVTTVNLT